MKIRHKQSGVELEGVRDSGPDFVEGASVIQPSSIYSKEHWEAVPELGHEPVGPVSPSWDALRDRCLRDAETMLDCHRFDDAESLLRMAALINAERRSR